MVAPLIASALIGAGSSLLGGLFGQNSEKDAVNAMNKYNSPEQIRKRAEKAGFNPLAFIGPGVGLQTALPANMIGQSIADAGAMLANGIADNVRYAGELAEKQKEIDELRKGLQEAVLRPHVPGVFGSSLGSAGGHVPPVPQSQGGVLSFGHTFGNPDGSTPDYIVGVNDPMQWKADPETAPALETDAYAAARQGTLPGWAARMWDLNTGADSVGWVKRVSARADNDGSFIGWTSGMIKDWLWNEFSGPMLKPLPVPKIPPLRIDLYSPEGDYTTRR